ncbi:MAG: fibronectin type III domain-containing protein [Crocinitomicaceae bacterium]|nr:fibronectin type III domain-containing protein [Flavobacteriales bacterium]NQZ37210.1 fibronectin type III domain-containing protein [Crocinitomicaceae bacterium]
MTHSFHKFIFRSIATSLTLFLSFIGYAQTIVVTPYLQNGSPASMTIMWETDASNDGYVDWGTSAGTLNNTVTSTSITGEGSNRIHTAKITGLTDDSKYYYQVRTLTGEVSATYFLKTHPTKSSETSVNIVAMSDMQRDNSNPNVFETIINSGIIPVANANYPNGMEDIEAILIPGDLVATGTYSSWRDTYLSPSTGITPYIPTYPVPGNHEYYGTGISLFLDYTDLPLNGSPSNPEEWWYKDISNLRIVGLNSNSPSADLSMQLLWLQTILDEAGADSTIDFVFAELHHPYKSELWLPGELDFTGDIIAVLEGFSTTYGKPSIHFFGHTHAYSRGQSRDHNHLWVNAATAGGAIDNWGEFPNADYDEFVISEDEYGFLMVEVEAGTDPKFVLKRYSQGDENVFENNTLSDEITIKRYSIAPEMPIGLTPIGEHDLQCIEFKGSAFSNGSNSHQASHWQIVEGCDFSDPSVQNVWKQSMNWYNEVDTQANDDLTDEDDVSLTANTSYCWRVRYRNSNLTWSDWSAPLNFNTAPSNYITGNLLLNGDAESGISNWTGDIESLTDNECGSVPVYQGTNFFAVGGVCANEQTAGLAAQTIDVSAYALDIDDEKYQIEYSGYLRTWGSNNDLPEMYIEFLNANNNLLGTSPVISNSEPEWLLQSGYESIPFATRTLRVVLEGTRLAGTDNDSYFDTLSVRLVESDCSSIGISEKDPNKLIKIYPNPTSGELFYETLIGYRSISINDQLGRQVFSTDIYGKSGAIDLSEINEGMYTITFINADAETSIKFIKKD